MTTFQSLTENLESNALECPEGTSRYHEFIARKHTWEPAEYVQVQINDIPKGLRQSMNRALALALALELPVGDYAIQASKREFNDAQKWALMENAADELTHFTAFSNYVNASNQVDTITELIPVADQFRQALEDTGEHPVLLGGFVELGAFFPLLSFFRKLGDTPLKIMTTEVSRDESVHVQTNWAIIDDNAIPFDLPRLNKVRHQIIDWVFSGLQSQKYGLDFWIRQSDELIQKREAVELKFTGVVPVVAFFETSNASLGKY